MTQFMTLIESLQLALAGRWNDRMPAMVAAAHNHAQIVASRLGLSGDEKDAVREAYLAGYRAAYWDGVVDFVDVGSSPEPVAGPRHHAALRHVTTAHH